MRILVTGAEGFVAHHLVATLQRVGHDVVGTALWVEGTAALGVPVEHLDITDAENCRSVVSRVSPTHIVHLAAASSVSWSFTHADETRQINVEGTQNLLAAALRLPVLPRVLVVGSAEEYGTNDGRPLPELPLSALHPLSPYATAKVEVERLIEGDPQFLRMTVRTRSFPHVGPGQRTGFIMADVASQLVEIERGQRAPVLHVGNIDAVRDYTDVRDVVRAYALLLERGTPGEVYNVCSGRGWRVRELLEVLVSYSRFTVHINRDQDRIRPSEIPALVGNSGKLQAATGWSPTISVEQTLRETLDWWRGRSQIIMSSLQRT